MVEQQHRAHPARPSEGDRVVGRRMTPVEPGGQLVGRVLGVVHQEVDPVGEFDRGRVQVAEPVVARSEVVG